MSEALLAGELARVGLVITPPSSLPEVRTQGGPDFLIEYDGRRIWIEVICPSSAGLPTDWLEPAWEQAVSQPDGALLLRWTASIKEKAEKLLGRPDRGQRGYIEKGVVKPEDAYVISVNGRMLRAGGIWASIRGVNQLPYATTIAFAIGDYQLHLDRATRQVVDRGHSHRPFVMNRNQAAVPTYTFLDPAFSGVSAIWATDITEDVAIGNRADMAVVHNRHARSLVPSALLPAWEEYSATFDGDVGEVVRSDGRLARRLGRSEA